MTNNKARYRAFCKVSYDVASHPFSLPGILTEVFSLQLWLLNSQKLRK
ncbi:MAG: hypothetical protein F6K14_23255 [Symploca sp. SIO2C1]|nr:hypothetical protein [Symploca sp. SIO2C1]